MFDDERMGKSRSMGKFSVPITSKQMDFSKGLEGVLGNRKKTPCCGRVFLEMSWEKRKLAPQGAMLSDSIADAKSGTRIKVTLKSINNL